MSIVSRIKRWTCNYLSMLGFNLILVSKGGPWCQTIQNLSPISDNNRYVLLSHITHVRKAIYFCVKSISLVYQNFTFGVETVPTEGDIGGLIACSLQWRHNEREGVSNHQRLDCLHTRLFRRRSKKTPKLRVTGLCEGNPSVTDGFPPQRASNAEIFLFDSVIMSYSIA